MAQKNAILKRTSYSAVLQAISKPVAFLPRKLGPATPQLGPRYHATGAPLLSDVGPVAP